jgi:hypothetical protein
MSSQSGWPSLIKLPKRRRQLIEKIFRKSEQRMRHDNRKRRDTSHRIKRHVGEQNDQPNLDGIQANPGQGYGPNENQQHIFER